MPVLINPETLNPQSIASLITKLKDLITGIIDFAQWLASLFSGRPTMAATAAEAQVFAARQSPVLRLMGVGAAVCLYQNVPLSDPAAGPLYGPYFAAAVAIENAIRWGDQSLTSTQLDDTTLTAAMHEAGNPGVAGTATMDAIDQAWLQLPNNSYQQQAVRGLSNYAGFGPSGDMVRAFGAQYTSDNPPPAPPTPPPPPPAPGVTINLTPNQTVAGAALFSATVLGGPYPDAHLNFLIDNQLIGAPLAPTTTATIGLTVSQAWDSTKVANGSHTLTCQWQGSAGIIHYSAAQTINVQNAAPAPAPVVASITLSLTSGQTVSGEALLSATVQGQADPNAHVNFLIDGQNVLTVAAPTTVATTPLTISGQWNSTAVANGDHTLAAQWQGQAGIIHAAVQIIVVVSNQQPQPTPTPTTTTGDGWTPTTVQAFETDFEQCCAETQNSLAVISTAIINLPGALQQLFPPGTATDYSTYWQQLIAIISGISGVLSAVQQIIAQTPANLAALLADLDNLQQLPPIAAALGQIAQAIVDIDANQPALLAELDCICKALQSLAAGSTPVDVSGIVAQLTRRNDDLQVPEDWKTQLINSGAVPPELVPLLQATTWETVSASAAHALGYALGWGVEETAALVERVMHAIVGPILSGMWNVFTAIISGFDAGSGISPASIGAAAVKLATWADTALTGIVGVATEDMITLYEKDIAGMDSSSIPGVEAITGKLVGRALEFGLAAHAIAALCELSVFLKELGLKEIAAMVAEFAGFKEIVAASHRPFLTAALARPATYAYNRGFPTALPARGEAMQWSARRFLADTDAQALFASAGLAPSWYPFLERARYRPVSARAIATLLQDQPIDAAAVTRILQDNSYADSDVTFMLKAYEYASLKNVRNSYVGELITAYGHGILADSDLSQALQGLGWSNDAVNLVIQRAALGRRVTLAQKVEQQIIPLVAQGSITPDEGLQQLEAAGIQDWHATLDITLATTKAEIHAAKLAATAAEREARQTQRNLTRAAIAEYQRGVLDAVALAAALALIGLSPSLITSIVSVQEAALVGRQRTLYGKLLSPGDAKLLAERVAAIEQQMKDTLIPPVVAAAQLKALGIDAADVDALIARWAASLKKTAGAALLINPLTGQ